MADKENIYNKISLDFKFEFLGRPVKLKTGFKSVFKNRNPVCKRI